MSNLNRIKVVLVTTAIVEEAGFPVLNGKHLQGMYLLLRIENGAYFLAESALRADRLVYLGIEKSLAVLTQGDAMLGATLDAGCATAAFTPPLLQFRLSTY